MIPAPGNGLTHLEDKHMDEVNLHSSRFYLQQHDVKIETSPFLAEGFG